MKMKAFIFLMVFQVLMGIWSFVSPFVMGLWELTGVAVNNMVFGALVVIFGVGFSYYEFYHGETLCDMDYVHKKGV
jgi:hypothetical protein